MENPFETDRVEVVAVSHLLAIMLLVLLAIVGIMSCVTAFGDDLPFRNSTKRDDDKVEITVQNDKTVISVPSPFGISQAIIELSGNNWPDTVTLRLHLKGLENLKVANGKDTLEASVSSQDGKLRRWTDGKEDSPLDSKHPYWMKIRMVSKDGKPVKTIPLKDGYFEMQLSKALYEENPKSITLNWIDLIVEQGVLMNFAVDVISDVICPWCYIGKRRLEKAIAASARRCFIPCCGCAETVPDVQGHLSG